MTRDTTPTPSPDADERNLASRLAGDIQQMGADPKRHVVLRASAGSGKTKVLVDRLLRLLIDGAPLKSVAAMTFTRKAAVEIRRRLTEEVVRFHVDDDGLEDLRRSLTKLLGRAPEDHHINRARRLVEEVLEDPAGVQVGTIHTFCQSLLSRFADLAGVDPGFRILEHTDELWNEALDRLERTIADDDHDRAAFTRLGPTPKAGRSSLNSFLNDRLALDHWCDRIAGRPDPNLVRTDLLPGLEHDLTRVLFTGTPLAGCDIIDGDAIRDQILDAVANYLDLLPDVLEAEAPPASKALVAYVAQRVGEAAALADTLRGGGTTSEVLRSLRKAVFTADQSPSGLKVKCGGAGSKATKEERHAALAEAAVPIARVCALGDLVDLLHSNVDRLRFGLRALDIYDGLKRRDRCLDFHDLERRAWHLVHDQDLGPWIQYRMDARIDHLLVDEFQDTNHNQWEIIEPFVQEFLAADTEEGKPRTVFLVGDVKQSIYGFRGACPALCSEAAETIAEASGIDPVLTLPTNFRSLSAVVETVGERFGTPPLADLLPSPEEVAAAAQLRYRDDAPGRVTCRPLELRSDDADPHEACAARITSMVQTIVASRDDVTFRDILILSRTRTHLAPYERAFREAGIPFVPAGRGALARSREVQDILALLRWLVFPSDDVALATVLRSLLIRFGERTLQTLLSVRKSRGGLWRRLRQATSGSEGWAASLLSSWLSHVDLDSSHDLLRRIFREAEALTRFSAVMDEQARYNLLRLHDLALAHDAGPFPSLRSFIAEIERAAVEQDQEEGTLPEGAEGRVRMMTIHGAKGLQARYVLILDTGSPLKEAPTSLQLGEHRGPLVSGLRKEHRHPPAELAATTLSTAAAAAVRTRLCEQANLLYVAMTRACDELEVLGVEPYQDSDKPSHYKWLVDSGQPIEDWPAVSAGEAASVDVRRDTLEPVPQEPLVHWCPPPSKPRLTVVHPSSNAPPVEPSLPVESSQDQRLDDDSTRSAADRGTRIHLWLQRAAELGSMPPGDGEEWAEALAVFENPFHDPIFRPGADVTALCEAPVLHRLPGNGVETRMQGVIDRLLIAPDRITVVDYKSNRVQRCDIPALVAHYRPQMNAYRDALAAAYPGRPVTAVLMFTHLAGDHGPGYTETLA